MSELTLPTRVAKAYWDDHLLFGRRLFDDIARAGAVDLLALAATGRAPKPEDRELFAKLGGCICVADPHIWPLKVVRVASAYGRVAAGLAAGPLLFDGERVGPVAAQQAAEWLARAHAALGAEPTDEATLAYAEAELSTGAIAGFGVPFRDLDERVTALAGFVQEHGAHVRPHWRIFEGVSRYMRDKRNVAPNIGSAASAVLLDMGFAVVDGRNVTLLFAWLAQLPNAIEGAAQAPAILRSMPSAYVRYEGPAPRVSPRRA